MKKLKILENQWILTLIGLILSLISLVLFFVFEFPLFLFILFLPPLLCSRAKIREKKGYCSKCGYKLMGFEQFCPICGRQFI